MEVTCNLPSILRTIRAYLCRYNLCSGMTAATLLCYRGQLCLVRIIGPDCYIGFAHHDHSILVDSTEMFAIR